VFCAIDWTICPTSKCEISEKEGQTKFHFPILRHHQFDGTSGIGRAAANKQAQLDIHVIVVGREAADGEKTLAEIRGAGGKAVLSPPTFETHPARAVAKRAVEPGNGHMDILVDEAGIYGASGLAQKIR